MSFRQNIKRYYKLIAGGLLVILLLATAWGAARVAAGSNSNTIPGFSSVLAVVKNSDLNYDLIINIPQHF